jgi:DNA repair exonuclease SbcCD nuclease subunit
MHKFKGYSGILFVGDPHIWSKKPGKRIDLDFTATVLDKINQAVDISIKENLYLIILGDLFHVDNENNIEMLTKLVRILKKLPEPCASVEGNHEKSQLNLSDDVAMTLLRESGVVYTLEKNGIEIQMTIGDKSVVIGSTPYGSKIPEEVTVPSKFADQNPFIIWLTHENLDFGESYPGVIPIKEIQGVSMLVNGHIHKTKKPKKVGGMVAHNPGNITRLSTDCVDHVPAVWKWTPEQGQDLEPISLNFHKEVFSMIGKQIEVDVAPSMVTEELSPKQTSVFVEKMERQLLEDQDKTDDGEYLKQSIRALALAMQIDSEMTEELMLIAEETLKEENS